MVARVVVGVIADKIRMVDKAGVVAKPSSVDWKLPLVCTAFCTGKVSIPGTAGVGGKAIVVGLRGMHAVYEVCSVNKVRVIVGRMLVSGPASITVGSLTGGCQD
jgi:hypothetical protein